MCPNYDWTCWKKFHDYYLPLGLFRTPHSMSERFKSVTLNRHNTFLQKQREVTNQTSENTKSACVLGNDITWPTNDEEDIIRGRKKIQEDLENDTTKNNYFILSNHEEGRKRLNEQMKADMKESNNGERHSINDTHELTLTSKFSV